MSPIHVVKYQIVLIFLVGSATTLGTARVVLLSFLRLAPVLGGLIA